jgi:hypothetical protein
MTSNDFVRGFLGLFPDQNFNEVKNKFFDSVRHFFVIEEKRKVNDLVYIAENHETEPREYVVNNSLSAGASHKNVEFMSRFLVR